MNSQFYDNFIPYNKITVSGKGQVSVIPDTAVIRLGVQSTGKDLESIQAENAEISQAIVNTFKEFGIIDIKTYQYVIDKLYDYENGKRIDQGYTVRNIFEIRTNDMGQVGAIIDAAVATGANVVDFITFEVSNSESFYLEALNLAISDAYSKVKSIINHLNLNVEPIPKQIVENSAPPIPFSRNVAERAFATTPIEPGKTEIEAAVTIDFIY